MSFYYLGDIPKAIYYMKRVIEGEFEPDGSVIKRIAFTMIKNSREKLRSQGYRHLIEEYEKNSRRSDFRLSKRRVKRNSSNFDILGQDSQIGGINKSSSQLLTSSNFNLNQDLNKSHDFGAKKSLLFSPVIPIGARRKSDFTFAAAKKPKTEYLRGKSKITTNRVRLRSQSNTSKKKVHSRSNLHTEEGFKNMIKGVLLRRGRNTSNKQQM